MPANIQPNDCASGDLAAVDTAFTEIVRLTRTVDDTETVETEKAMGRVLAASVKTGHPLPPFDHSAVDGFGLYRDDLGRLPRDPFAVRASLPAGHQKSLPLQAGEAIRLFTGAAIPAGVAAVVLEERCVLSGSAVTVGVAVADGANIRRRGEDVPEGAVVADPGTVLDSRHMAILFAAGVSQVVVRRRINVAVLSNGNELREAGSVLRSGEIHDANRPMLRGLLACPWIETIDLGCHCDDPAVLARVFAEAAEVADVIVSSGGVAGSDADHIARAVLAAGGSVQRFRLALKPGKPILAGRLGAAAVLGLPGNPIAAMVNFMLFARPLIAGTAGLTAARPVGESAVTAAPFHHAAGRTEFAPVRVVGTTADGRPCVEKLGKGGSARLRPLVLADGLAEVAASEPDLPAGAPIALHRFAAPFAT